ncbi:MAG TPA: cysteine desulfurase NifS [Lentisphaeria bacterium]|nr:MAG: cysteine desulfurase NifS [Lentisphaerae bacterium GWF2_38_69]HBM17595.1 cysteine desulfurase NifS [Lentisphaeria bacterium]
MNNKIVYVDNNATTAVDPEVFEAMKPFLTQFYGNPSSIHYFGGQVAAHIAKGREQIASLLGAEPSEITFTSCGTESDSSAILSALNTCPTRRKIVTSKVEHPAVLNLCKQLRNKGYIVSEAPVDKLGRIDLNIIKELIDTDTALVSIMWANNETGNIYPVEKIAEIAHEKGAIFHTDAVQSVGKIPINLKNTQIDLLSISGHKLHAPKGIGILYVKKGMRFYPFMIGGHQENGRRAGTENVASIVAIGKAAELAGKHMAFENSEVKELRDYLESQILKKVKNSRVNGDIENRVPNTTNIAFDMIEGEAILLLLDKAGICASSGSACTTGSLEPSHVLRAMGVPYTSAHGSLRLSLSRYNTKEEMDYIIETLIPIIAKLRAISPYWKE